MYLVLQLLGENCFYCIFIIITVPGSTVSIFQLFGVLGCIAFLQHDFCISVSGIATFKKADELRATIADVPLDRLLVETDSPYLAPVPHRGKRNEPAFVAHTAKVVAEIKQVSADELARITTDNFFRLFAKADRARLAA